MLEQLLVERLLAVAASAAAIPSRKRAAGESVMAQRLDGPNAVRRKTILTSISQHLRTYGTQGEKPNVEADIQEELHPASL